MKRSVRLRREEGVAMTEFALVLPVFVLIIAGLLSFGRVLFYWIEANHIANETARWAAVDRLPPGTTATNLQQYARDSAPTGEFSSVHVCISTPGGGPATEGGPIEVRISRPFSFVPILGIGNVTVRGSSTMRIEQFRGGDGTTPVSYQYDSTPPSTYPSPGAPFGACS